MKRVLIAGDVVTGRVSIPASYARALRAAGAVGAVAIADTAEDAQALAEAFDALLMPGGGDLPGALFGQPEHPAASYDDPLRDQSDRLLMEAFRGAGKRVLGICRGCQVANVFLGGTLHQHLPDAYDPVLWHSGNITGRHRATIEAGSLLAELLGAGELLVNSSHHQAMDAPGQGLRIVARAPDGVAEAAEGEGILLVQWHPERMGEDMRPVFDWLIGAR
ncbi:MAG: gamma-glutamyl-gamma-aminobutyrate hydrolase family protein [Oscillospiraceae bacterium]|jgi:putative glutamine amidotransferase|nr:gamma-glutamyl-gamma-aminobutyrate hydrolase family protein [Oscillospiraceae bacterium]